MALEIVSSELEALYAQVPASRCASSGECCRLTEAEYHSHFATMFPLYRVEYCHLVQFIEWTFPADRRQELFSWIEERPQRCPMAGDDHRCTIYPARPMICRTYGVMNPATIAQAVSRHRDMVPEDWLDRFARREGAMSCPRVRVMEPQKLERHAHNLIHFTYERELSRLSRGIEIADPLRQQLFAEITGRSTWPLRWSWGGFNALRFTSLEWLHRQFRKYWQSAELVDAG